MNKVIYICVAATMALASCSNDEVVEQAKENAISFRSVVGMNTKGTEATTVDFQDKGELYVTTFMENGNVLYDETPYLYDGSVWIARPAQSWNGNKNLSFYLTYPKLDEWEKGAKIEKKDPEVYITVDEEIPEQKDYLAAYLENVSKTDENAAVLVEMKHLLSLIEIQAKNSNDRYIYKVRGIRLCGVNSRMSFYLDDPSGWGKAGTIDFTPKDYEQTYAEAITLGKEAKSLMGSAGNAILLPQSASLINAWNGADTSETPGDYVGKYISVLVNITAKAGASIYPVKQADDDADLVRYGWVAVPVEFIWESGKKYVYTLDFTNGAGKVDPTDPGSDVGSGDPDKAQPIFGGAIKFNVAVSDWSTSSSNVILE